MDTTRIEDLLEKIVGKLDYLVQEIRSINEQLNQVKDFSFAKEIVGSLNDISKDLRPVQVPQ
jgi:hypothetical protein